MVHRSELLHAPHFGRFYHRRAPAAALAPFVEAYWRLDGYQAIPQGVAEHYLPRLQGQLIFAFDNQCLYQRAQEPLLALSGPHALGPQFRALACLHPASRGLLGVALRPGTLALLLGRPLGDTIQPLPELLPLQAELAAAPFETQIARLEAWLFQALAGQADAGLSPALERLAVGEPVAAAAARAGWVPRSLQRHCRQQLGLSPRDCQRVLRLRAALEQLWLTRTSVFETDYYDYSHFYREFRTMIGLSPQAYLARFG